jgi:hypothetical protein
MAIKEVTLREIGFADEEGFAYFRDNTQVIQLRLSRHGRTLIWHATTTITDLHRQFSKAVRDMSYILNIPLHKLNAYTALYGVAGRVVRLPVFFHPEDDHERYFNKAHQEFLVEERGGASFARLDLDTSQLVSLYGSITGRSATREVAFLGPMVPESILSFFRTSSDIRLNDLEINYLLEFLGPKITDLVQR